MKTKQQKRLEAIERLERKPRVNRYVGDEAKQKIWGKRLEEAARLRLAFNHPKS